MTHMHTQSTQNVNAMSMREKVVKALLAAGLTSSLAVGGWFLTAQSEAPNGVPILPVYLDTGNITTACLGSTRDLQGNRLKLGTKYTEEQCVDMFVKDYIEHYRLMKQSYKGQFMTGWQEAAITDFVFNKGIGNFRSSTLLKKLKAQQHEEACLELTKWIFGRNTKGEKVVIKGLINRATKEYQWCMGEVPYEAKTLKEVIDSKGL